MTTGQKILLSIVIVFGLCIGYLFYFVTTTPDFQPGEIIKTPSEAYLEIFPHTTRQRITAEYVAKPKYGNLLCDYSYDNGKYKIQEYVIDATIDQSLKDFITIANKDGIKPHYTYNNQIRDHLFNVCYKSIFPKASHLSLNLSGDSMKILSQNDTMKSFSLLYRNLSIKCNGSDTSAIFSVAQPYYDEDKYVASPLPVNIMFIKRKKAIYFLMMSVVDRNTKLSPDMLTNLMRGQ